MNGYENVGTLRRSMAIQVRVIGALLMREVLTRFGRHNIGFLWLFVEPMMFTMGITTLWVLTKAVHGGHLPIVAFAVTGYSSVLLWRNMPSRTIGAMGPNLSLLYHRQVKILDIYISRVLLEFAGATTSFMTLTLLFTAVGAMKLPENVLEVIGGWLVLTWFGVSFALFLGAVSERSELIDKIWHPASYLLFPLSGAAFMVDWLPAGAQKVVLFLPMVHGVEIVREGFFGSQVHAHYNLPYLLTFCLCLTGLSLIQVKAVGRELSHD